MAELSVGGGLVQTNRLRHRGRRHHAQSGWPAHGSYFLYGKMRKCVLRRNLQWYVILAESLKQRRGRKSCLEREVRQAVGLTDEGLNARCLLARRVTLWLYLPHLTLPSLPALAVPMSRQLALQSSPHCCCVCRYLPSLTALEQPRPQPVPVCLWLLEQRHMQSVPRHQTRRSRNHRASLGPPAVDVGCESRLPASPSGPD